MQPLIVHTIPGSPFGRSAALALEEKGLPWRLAPVAPGTLKVPAHMALHPFGRIPVLADGDFRLYETQAIVRYVDRLAASPALTPTDIRAAALMDQAMNVSDWYLFQGVSSVIAFQRVVGPRLMGLTPNEAAIAEAMPKARMVVDELARLLGDKPFFAGDAFSLAEVMLAPQIDFLAETPEWAELSAAHPNLNRWLAALRARPSMQKTTWDAMADLAKAA